MINSNNILPDIKKLIKYLRRNVDIEKNWTEFKENIELNINEVCRSFNTRWLISVCDTYVDYGNELEKRNAMFVVLIANLEKLWATNLLMYDVKLNPSKLSELKKNKVIPLWDGMYSFNINHGDMTSNMIRRLNSLFVQTPVLEKIFNTVLKRMNNNTTLANLDKYHRRLFEPYPKRSIFFGFIKKIRKIVKNYRLVVC